MNLWIYVVYRYREEYSSDDYGDSGTTYEMLTPVAGYEKKADAVEHAARANKQKLVNNAVNEWDPFLDPTQPAYSPYRVGAVPLCVPSSVDAAPKEMAGSIEVLRDIALETQDKALASGLPAIPVKFPLWATSSGSKSGVTHYFEGPVKKANYGFNSANTSPCGVYLGVSSYSILDVAAGKRQCLNCLRIIQRKASNARSELFKMES